MLLETHKKLRRDLRRVKELTAASPPRKKQAAAWQLPRAGGTTGHHFGPPGQSWKRTARGVVPRRTGPSAAATSRRTCSREARCPGRGASYWILGKPHPCPAAAGGAAACIRACIRACRHAACPAYIRHPDPPAVAAGRNTRAPAAASWQLKERKEGIEVRKRSPWRLPAQRTSSTSQPRAAASSGSACRNCLKPMERACRSGWGGV